MKATTETESLGFQDQFWSAILRRNTEKTIPACLERCEETGRISNFAHVSSVPQGTYEGRFYNDACLYKVIEGVANTLALKRDPQLEQYADSIIEKICGAQQEDGYLSTYFQLAEPGRRWTDMGMHEMYCAGHLLEAAMAYLDATGKDPLYRAALRFVAHIMNRFGEGKEVWVPGHQEIELALIKLYKRTQDRSYLDFAHWLIEQRGHGHSRGRDYEKEQFYNLNYNQDDKPFSEQRVVEGHAVRAMYLYIAATDYVRETGDNSYMKALMSIWENVVCKNMYITGGIGSTKENEGFTEDYSLPNKTAYNETCASVGMVMWNHRLSLLTGEAKYFDVAERALYNGVLSGVGLDGVTFFYDNVLESDGDKKRSPWFTTSCCPTQLSRFIPTVKNYFYAQRGNDLWVNLYGASEAAVTLENGDMVITQQTDYPYGGSVKLTIAVSHPLQARVHLRIPDWCENYHLASDFEMGDLEFRNGYLVLERLWGGGNTVTLQLDMPVVMNHAHECVREDRGKVALSRGPLVYCLEDVDNGDYEQVTANMDTTFAVVDGTIQDTPTSFIQWRSPDHGHRFTAIPYFLWNNREPCRMKVWF